MEGRVIEGGRDRGIQGGRETQRKRERDPYLMIFSAEKSCLVAVSEKT